MFSLSIFAVCGVMCFVFKLKYIFLFLLPSFSGFPVTYKFYMYDFRVCGNAVARAPPFDFCNIRRYNMTAGILPELRRSACRNGAA